jgi:hypothetical protein
MLNRPKDDTLEIARNQYKATLESMSFEALYKLAWDEHRIRGKVTRGKAELIDRILEAKYGKDTR